MVSDAPYDAPEPALPVALGAPVGAAGALVMLAAAALWLPVSAYLRGVARVIAPDGWVDAEVVALAAGTGVQAAVGGLLGLVYASSQRRAPTPAVVVGGVAFGIMVWVGARVGVGWVGHETVRQTVRSWGWLCACVAYAQVLAVAALCWQRWRPAAVRVAPKD
jgi:hypothetical protein